MEQIDTVKEKIEAIKNELLEKLNSLEYEANQIYKNLVKPEWDIYNKHYSTTLYGLMMMFFSLVDLLSAYINGSDKNQTKRMVNFLVDYLGYPEDETIILVNLFRHKLMHTSEPRKMIWPEKDEYNYRWLLHWGEELPRNQHMKFCIAGNDKILNCALFYLIEDLKKNMKNIFSGFDREKALVYHKDLENQKVSWKVDK